MQREVMWMSYIRIINRVFKKGDVGGLWEGSLNEHGAVLGATRVLARLTRVETYIPFKVIQFYVKFIRTIDNFKTKVARIISEFVYFCENIPMRALRISCLYWNINSGLFLHYLFFFLFLLPTKSLPASAFFIPSIAWWSKPAHKLAKITKAARAYIHQRQDHRQWNYYRNIQDWIEIKVGLTSTKTPQQTFDQPQLIWCTHQYTSLIACAVRPFRCTYASAVRGIW